MSVGEILFRQVLADPADREVRLVYADWLLEQGDQQGEFIQLQVQAEKLHQYDPARKKLETKARKLLKEHGGPGTLPDGVKNFDYRAGFVEWVELSIRQFLKIGEELFAGSPVRDLDLTGSDTRKLSTSPLLEHPEGILLKKVSEYSILDDEGLDRLVTSPRIAKLKRLSILSSMIGSASIDSIANSPHMSSLEQLDIYNNAIGDFGPELASSQFLTNMRGLAVFQNDGAEWTDTSLIAIARSENFARLQELSLHGTFTAKGCEAFANSDFKEPLERLDLYATIKTGGAETLMTSARLARLKWLNLDSLGSNAGNGVLEAIADSMHDLEVLDLDRCTISDKGAEMLATAPVLSGIRRLKLQNNQLTIRGIRALAESKYWTKKDIFLRGNNVSAADITALHSDYGKQFGRL